MSNSMYPEYPRSSNPLENNINKGKISHDKQLPCMKDAKEEAEKARVDINTLLLQAENGLASGTAIPRTPVLPADANLKLSRKPTDTISQFMNSIY